MGKIILRLDRVMADRKIALKDLSEKVGVSNVNLSKMKTGKISAIRFSTLEAICEALDCQPGDILEYDPEARYGYIFFGADWSYLSVNTILNHTVYLVVDFCKKI